MIMRMSTTASHSVGPLSHSCPTTSNRQTLTIFPIDNAAGIIALCNCRPFNERTCQCIYVRYMVWIWSISGFAIVLKNVESMLEYNVTNFSALIQHEWSYSAAECNGTAKLLNTCLSAFGCELHSSTCVGINERIERAQTVWKRWKHFSTKY